MQSHARVVVIGGGNMGAGVLYHLAHMGWTDCVLLEKAELTSGATWHAAGLVSRMTGGQALGAMHDYAVDLYKRIEAETEVGVSWHNCGSLRVATSPEHMDWINHIRDVVLARGQDAQIIDAAQVARLNPLYDVEAAGVLGAIYTPDDGHVDPSGTCQAMAKGARQLGARVIRNCRVTGTRQLPSGEWEVTTEHDGAIIAEHVVNAGGYHARQVGAMARLDLPITTLAALLSWQPAAIAGIDDRHGRPIAVGEPANLCVLDPNETWTVRGTEMASRSHNSPWEGRELRGRVRHTILQGEFVVTQGEATR